MAGTTRKTPKRERTTTKAGSAGRARNSARPVKARSKPRSAADVQARIRDRAYQLYLNRGGEHGQALSDWLEAERELLASVE